MKDPIKFTDVVNWSRLGTVGGIILAVTLLGLSHYSHAQILTKAVGDTPLNWNVTYAELIGGIVSALTALVASWRATEGQAAVVLNTQVSSPVVSDDETVGVLLMKVEQRCRRDAANAILTGGTK